MGFLETFTGGAVPGTEADIIAFRATVTRLETERAEALADIAQIPDAMDRALLAEDDAGADKLEKILVKKKRLVRRHEIVEPVIRRRLFEAEEKLRDIQIAKHRVVALACLDDTKAALDAVVAANAKAEKAFIAAAEEMGPAVAHSYAAAARWDRITAESVQHWSKSLEEILGRRARVYPTQLGGVEVEITAPHSFHQIGDRITVADHLAHRMVEGGGAVYAKPDSVVVPFDPRKAEPPEPDERGYVGVAIIRSTSGFWLAPKDEAGGLVAGDLARVPLSQGIRLVRGGYAEFLPNVTLAVLDAGDDL